MIIETAERIYRQLLAADKSQLEASYRSIKTHPTYTHDWDTPEAIAAQAVLGEERTTAIRYEFWRGYNN